MTPLMAVRKEWKLDRKDVAAELEIEYSHLYRIEMAQAQASPALAIRLSEYFEGAITRDQILFPHLYEEVKTKKPPTPTPTKKPSARATAGSVAAHG